MKVYCTVVGKKFFTKKSGEDCFTIFISTSDFTDKDGFFEFEFYKLVCDEDTYDNVSYLSHGFVDLFVYSKDGKNLKYCSNFEVLHD